MSATQIAVQAAFEAACRDPEVCIHEVVLAFETALQLLHGSCDFKRDAKVLNEHAHRLMSHHNDASRPLKELIAFALNQEEL